MWGGKFEEGGNHNIAFTVDKLVVMMIQKVAPILII